MEDIKDQITKYSKHIATYKYTCCWKFFYRILSISYLSIGLCLQLEEPEVDCVGLFMSTLPRVFCFLWK